MDNRFKNWRAPKFDKSGMTKWGWKCQHHKNLKLGTSVDIGSFTYINAKYGVELENDVQIGSHCSIYSVSTIDKKQGKVLIKKNARIGTHSTIMPGVKVGENSIIGAFSFVNKDVPDNVVAVGVPVKVIRRLTRDEIKKLEEDTK